MSDALSLTRVGKRFGGVVALDAVDLSVRRGEVLGLVGPNGAGKSVLVNVITGFYAPSAGSVRLAGRDVTGEGAHTRARLGMARTFQNIRLFRRMTVLENVLVAAKQHARRPFRSLFSGSNRAHTERGLSLLERMGLAEQADAPAGVLAYGQARRLEIARALAGEPQLLLLDEPAAGMNEREREELSGHLQALRSTVPAMLVIEHDMGFLRRLCDRMAVLDYGRKIADGPVEQVLHDPAVVEAYIGAEP